MINSKSTDSMILIRVINLGERLMKKIIKNKHLYLLDNFLADTLFINNLTTSTEEVLIKNKLIKKELKGLTNSKLLELEEVGLTGISLAVKAIPIEISNKLHNKSKTRLALRRLFDGIILVLESLAKVFSKLEPFVEMLKLLKNISKVYDDPYLPSFL